VQVARVSFWCEFLVRVSRASVMGFMLYTFVACTVASEVHNLGISVSKKAISLAYRRKKTKAFGYQRTQKCSGTLEKQRKLRSMKTSESLSGTNVTIVEFLTDARMPLETLHARTAARTQICRKQRPLPAYLTWAYLHSGPFPSELLDPCAFHPFAIPP